MCFELPFHYSFIKGLRFHGEFAYHRDFQDLSSLNWDVSIKFIFISLNIALLVGNS